MPWIPERHFAERQPLDGPTICLEPGDWVFAKQSVGSAFSEINLVPMRLRFLPLQRDKSRS